MKSDNITTDNSMTNNNNKYSPELRFPEFQNSKKWEIEVIKNICDICTGKSNTQDQVKDGEYPFFIRSKVPVKSKKYLFDCEAVITIGDGKIGQVYHYVTGKFDLHQRCYKMSNFRKVMGKYFYYYFSSHFYERAMKMTAKATVDSVRLEMIADMPFLLPSFLEQKKIADCLSSLDIYLDTTKRKLELLKEYKKGLMQQLFPRNGKNVPELRFPEFTGEWAEKRLGDSFKERKEKNRNDLPLLSLGEKGLLYQSDTNRKDNSNTDKSKYLRIALGDIAYNTMRMWQGRCVFVDKEGIVSPAYTVCQPKEGIDSMFHYYLFKTHKMIEKFHRNSQGLVSDTLNLKFETFSKIKYFLPPSLTEQKKIADFLSKLDELIISESQQLEALNAHKNGLMQRLFPKISTQDL